jgi:hypothetical protein
MRIAYTSDLHADFGALNASLVPHLALRAATLRPDVLLVCGDVADTASAVGAALEVFRNVDALRVYLPGNHDIYAEGSPGAGPTSRDKFESLLPRVVSDAGFQYLGLEPLRHRNVAFVGTPGFWDYSLRDPALEVFVDLGHYRAGMWRGERAFDRGSVLWPRQGPAPPTGAQPLSAAGDWAGDEEISAWFLDSLDRQLARVTGAPSLVAAVHVLPCVEAVQRGVFGPSGFHDAYLGSVEFGARLRREARLRAIVTGHMHRPVDARLGSAPVVSRPVGHLRDSGISLEAVAAERLGLIEID